MDTSAHTVLGLFAQLGIGERQQDVDAFVAKHGGLSSSTKITEADFFSESQQTFLKQEWHNDSEWAAAIDELNVLLH
ncbi:DUF2789 family protein [Marinomonas sp.]|uniref:DUF2789 family protein n=1 Tax=Marinomonas sp. TaxID=1904862 RepID=UPI003BA9DB32